MNYTDDGTPFGSIIVLDETRLSKFSLDRQLASIAHEIGHSLITRRGTPELPAEIEVDRWLGARGFLTSYLPTIKPVGVDDD